MRTRQQKQLITYKSISIYNQNYQVPVMKNNGVKIVQIKIQERKTLFKEGVRYHHHLGGLIKRKSEISQGEILEEIQLFINDYTHIIDFLENYKNSYHDFLLILTEDFKKLFKQKYLEIKKIED